MNQNFAILELKYGNIYGGFPNYFVVAEISFLVFERNSNKIFIESWLNTLNLDYVSVFSKTDDLGHTVSREREVVNMKTKRRMPFDEEFKHNEETLSRMFQGMRPIHSWIKKFLLNAFRKYKVSTIVVFDGRRDIFLCEKAGVDFRRFEIFDLQKALNKETDYLFSLNKLSKVIDFRVEGSYLKSNNLEYWLHPIAAKQIVPNTATWDAARLLMVHNEYELHHQNFMMKGALLLNKIQKRKEENPQVEVEKKETVVKVDDTTKKIEK